MKPLHILLTILVVLLALGFISQRARIVIDEAPQPLPQLRAPLFDNLGSHHHEITTDSELAQRYFDQGLVLAFGFNHEEAFRSFEQATELDPECAMCYWGAALVLGPNINAPMDPSMNGRAYNLTQQALKHSVTATPNEQSYINALAARYAQNAPENRASLDIAYAEAMREVVRQFPNDVDAATLCAEAFMDVTPWNYWTKDGSPTEYTKEIVSTLESVIARSPNHPGANHYYIHAVEASKTPGRAIRSAERLGALVPGAGHLVHMPAHTFWRVGRYHDAVIANEHAIHADETYMPDRGIQGFYPTAYYPHNIHFLFAASAMEGNSEQTLEAARKLVAEIPASRYQEFPMLEDFMPMPLFAMTRFGKWEMILAEPKPASLYQYTTGIWHYARGLAFLRKGQLQEAISEYQQLVSIAENPAMAELILSSFSPASTILRIALYTLGGELAKATGDSDSMILRLQEAVAIQDSLAYIEPPAWYYPVRQSLGAALLELDRAAEAEAVYRQDLQDYPENGWSLFGLTQSLEAQGKTEEAAEMRARFEEAWAWADVVLASSRF